MANTKDVIFTIIKWAIMIIALILLIKLTIDLVNNGKSFKTEQIIYYICTYLILLFAFFGAWKEEFVYLVICAVALILDLVFAWSARSSLVENNALVVALTVMVCISAVMLRFASAHSVSMA